MGRRKTYLQSKATRRLAELELQSRKLPCFTKPAALLLSSPGPVPWIYQTALENPARHAPSHIDGLFHVVSQDINFDGLSSLLLRNVTTYVLVTAGGNIARKLRESKRLTLKR